MFGPYTTASFSEIYILRSHASPTEWELLGLGTNKLLYGSHMILMPTQISLNC